MQPPVVEGEFRVEFFVLCIVGFKPLVVECFDIPLVESHSRVAHLFGCQRSLVAQREDDRAFAVKALGLIEGEALLQPLGVVDVPFAYAAVVKLDSVVLYHRGIFAYRRECVLCTVSVKLHTELPLAIEEFEALFAIVDAVAHFGVVGPIAVPRLFFLQRLHFVTRFTERLPEPFGDGFALFCRSWRCSRGEEA